MLESDWAKYADKQLLQLVVLDSRYCDYHLSLVFAIRRGCKCYVLFRYRITEKGSRVQTQQYNATQNTNS